MADSDDIQKQVDEADQEGQAAEDKKEHLEEARDSAEEQESHEDGGLI